MNSNPTRSESKHMQRVKEQPCSVCGAEPPSEAHHIVQGDHFTTIAVCVACHRGPMGWHGDRTLWRIHKATPLGALNRTLKGLLRWIG
jgi:hypothetical protein